MGEELKLKQQLKNFLEENQLNINHWSATEKFCVSAVAILILYITCTMLFCFADYKTLPTEQNFEPTWEGINQPQVWTNFYHFPDQPKTLDQIFQENNAKRNAYLGRVQLRNEVDRDRGLRVGHIYQDGTEDPVSKRFFSTHY